MVAMEVVFHFITVSTHPGVQQSDTFLSLKPWEMKKGSFPDVDGTRCCSILTWPHLTRQDKLPAAVRKVTLSLKIIQRGEHLTPEWGGGSSSCLLDINSVWVMGLTRKSINIWLIGPIISTLTGTELLRSGIVFTVHLALFRRYYGAPTYCKYPWIVLWLIHISVGVSCYSFFIHLLFV